jgi:hypothetical protein
MGDTLPATSAEQSLARRPEVEAPVVPSPSSAGVSVQIGAGWSVVRPARRFLVRGLGSSVVRAQS